MRDDLACSILLKEIPSKKVFYGDCSDEAVMRANSKDVTPIRPLEQPGPTRRQAARRRF